MEKDKQYYETLEKFNERIRNINQDSNNTYGLKDVVKENCIAASGERKEIVNIK